MSYLGGNYYNNSFDPSEPLDYLVKAVSTTATARNGQTGNIDFSGSHDVVWAAILSSITNNGGGRVLFKGAFTLNNFLSLPDNTELAGADRTSKLIASSTMGNNAVIQRIGSSGAPCTNIYMHDFEIDCSNQNQTFSTSKKGIGMQYLLRCTIERLYVHNSVGSGIGTDYLQRVAIMNNRVENAGASGQTSGANGIGIGTGGTSREPVIVSGNVVIGSGDNNYIFESQGNVTSYHQAENNYSESAGNGGYSVNGSSYINLNSNQDYGSKYGLLASLAGTQKPTNLIVTNNQFISNTSNGINADQALSVDAIIANNIIRNSGGIGIKWFGSEISILGNLITDIQNTAIYVQPASGATGHNIIISSNNCLRYGQAQTAGNQDGIRLDAGNQAILYARIMGNHCIEDSGTPKARYGIVLVSVNAMTDVVCEDNICRGNVTAQIFRTGSGTGLIIRNCPGYNPLAGASISVTASPFTYTTGNSPELVAVYGGTVSSITVAGQQVADSTGRAFPVPPNTAVVVTYTVAPTMSSVGL